MIENKKPIILIFIPNYLPGFKAGGILKTVSNTVEYFSKEFIFKIVTRDRDLGDIKAYVNIQHGCWNKQGNSEVYYFSPGELNVNGINKLLEITSYDLVYLNSFFDPIFTLRIFLMQMFRKKINKPVVIAPRGELCKGCLSIKSQKKSIYLKLVRLFINLDQYLWHASSQYEKVDIIRELGVNKENVTIALDLPSPNYDFKNFKPSFKPSIGESETKIVFLSRITREKNLDYALRILKKVRTNIQFDIYGTREDIDYWEVCQKMIKVMPPNIRVNYCGIISPSEVRETFSSYELFFFPTKGENYAHVIIESLCSGTPVLISTETPWRNLKNDGLGWDLPLEDENEFVSVLENLKKYDLFERTECGLKISTKIRERVYADSVIEDNRNLFLRPLIRTN